MEFHLSLNQTRVIGCLVEKEVTTPDQYPLSLNALTNACNQKSNREPVMALDESTVQEIIDELSALHLVTSVTGFGSRVSKYKHRFCNTEFSELKLNKEEMGIICVLFLRGPQTPGEIRTRTQRLCEFSSVQDVEALLVSMSQNPIFSCVQQLPREPGKRESRWMHLFGDKEAPISEPTSSYSESDSANTHFEPPNELAEKLKAMCEKIEYLELEVEELNKRVEQLEN